MKTILKLPRYFIGYFRSGLYLILFFIEVIFLAHVV